MRLESNRDGTYKVWLSSREYDMFLDHAGDDEALAVAIRLGGEVGLRHGETTRARPEHLKESVVDLSESPTLDAQRTPAGREVVHWLEVHGKDTSGATEDGKRRDALVPPDVVRDLQLFRHKQSLDDEDEYISVTSRSLRRWISDHGDDLAEATGNPDWSHVSTHDLRRYYATTMLQVHGMNPEVVMAVGGWDSYAALRPYLQSPVEEVIAADFARAGLL